MSISNNTPERRLSTAGGDGVRGVTSFHTMLENAKDVKSASKSGGLLKAVGVAAVYSKRLAAEGVGRSTQRVSPSVLGNRVVSFYQDDSDLSAGVSPEALA